MEVFQDLVAEAGADMSDVAPCVAFPHGEDEGAEERPGAPWRREPGDHHFLSLCRLDLQPIRCDSRTDVVAAVIDRHCPGKSDYRRLRGRVSREPAWPEC